MRDLLQIALFDVLQKHRTHKCRHEKTTVKMASASVGM